LIKIHINPDEKKSLFYNWVKINKNSDEKKSFFYNWVKINKNSEEEKKKPVLETEHLLGKQILR
jgi:hypothetical protein